MFILSLPGMAKEASPVNSVSLPMTGTSPFIWNRPALYLVSASEPPWASIAFLITFSAASSAAQMLVASRATAVPIIQRRMGILRNGKVSGYGPVLVVFARREAGFVQTSNRLYPVLGQR